MGPRHGPMGMPAATGGGLQFQHRMVEEEAPGLLPSKGMEAEVWPCTQEGWRSSSLTPCPVTESLHKCQPTKRG